MTKVCPQIEVGLRNTLQNASKELGQLSQLIEPMEVALENASCGLDGIVLQNIDLISQTIDAVSGFLAQVAEDMPTDMKLDVGSAIASVHLEATRNRLVPETVSNRTSFEETGVGAVDGPIAIGVPDFF